MAGLTNRELILQFERDTLGRESDFYEKHPEALKSLVSALEWTARRLSETLDDEERRTYTFKTLIFDVYRLGAALKIDPDNALIEEVLAWTQYLSFLKQEEKELEGELA